GNRAFMLKLEQQGIKRALVDSQQVSADLLDASGDSPAVLRSQDIECLEDHQRERTLQDVRLFLHGGSTFRFPTGIMTCFLLESNRTFFGAFYSTTNPENRPGHCSLKVYLIRSSAKRLVNIFRRRCSHECRALRAPLCFISGLLRGS